MPPCHGGGRGFEPRPDRHFGSVAQSVEQRTENPRVAGSIPAGTTIRMMQVYPSPAEGIGLENRQRINVLRGFESLNLRHWMLLRRNPEFFYILIKEVFHDILERITIESEKI